MNKISDKKNFVQSYFVFVGLRRRRCVPRDQHGPVPVGHGTDVKEGEDGQDARPAGFCFIYVVLFVFCKDCFGSNGVSLENIQPSHILFCHYCRLFQYLYLV